MYRLGAFRTQHRGTEHPRHRNPSKTSRRREIRARAQALPSSILLMMDGRTRWCTLAVQRPRSTPVVRYTFFFHYFLPCFWLFGSTSRERECSFVFCQRLLADELDDGLSLHFFSATFSITTRPEVVVIFLTLWFRFSKERNDKTFFYFLWRYARSFTLVTFF